MSEMIEASKSGIKMELPRFLGDAAAGYLFLLLSFLYYASDNNFHEIVTSGSFSDIGQGLKIAILILIFLLATPIGRIINFGSWFIVFGLVQIFLEVTLIRWIGSIRFTALSFAHSLGEVEQFFGIKRFLPLKGWYSTSRCMTNALNLHFPEKAAKFHFLSGGVAFFRGASILLASFSFFPPLKWYQFWIWIAAITLFFLSAASAYYYHLKVLNVCRVILQSEFYCCNQTAKDKLQCFEIALGIRAAELEKDRSQKKPAAPDRDGGP